MMRSGATAAAPLPGGGSGAMAAQDVLGQTARLASSSALLQVRGRPSLLPPHPHPPAAAAARRGPAGASRAASFTGAVPGGHLRAERLHPALPLPGAHRRGQCQVRRRRLSGHLEASRGWWGRACARCWSRLHDLCHVTGYALINAVESAAGCVTVFGQFVPPQVCFGLKHR